MIQTDWSDIERKLQDIDEIPTLPNIMLKAMRIILNPDNSIQDLQLLLRNDPALTSRILQVANSSYYGLRNTINSLRTAMVMLGMREVGRLVVTVSILNSIPRDAVGAKFDFLRFWQHSASVGEVAQALVQETHVKVDGDVFTLGLLHDIGKLALATAFETDFIACITLAEEESISLIESEKRILGTDHARIGAQLAGQWGLSEAFEEVIRNHHSPRQSESYRVKAALIYLAGRICNHFGTGFGSETHSCPIEADPAWTILEEAGARLEAIEWNEMMERMKQSIENTVVFTELAAN